MTSTYSAATAPERATQDAAVAGRQYEQILFDLSRRFERAARDHGQRLQKFWTDAAEAQRRFAEGQKDTKLADDAKDYSTDMQQRFQSFTSIPSGGKILRSTLLVGRGMVLPSRATSWS